MKNKLGKSENLVEFHSNGSPSYRYRVDSYGYSCECTYDENDNRLTFKNSDGFSSESTYDENGNRLTFKNNTAS